MTISALKEVLEERLSFTNGSLSAMKQTDETDGYAIRYLEGRVEELRVCLSLVNALENQPKKESWDKQSRHNWPDFTFGDLSSYSVEESEPGIERHDPERC